MALTAFDGNFSFRQEELARLGGHEPSQMTKEQWQEFQDSPFMKSMRKADECCYEKTKERDEKRKARDPEFDPQDSDWKAEKSFQYDKGINYYKVMGIDDLASLAEVKAAYKKLSLVFHPDKTAGMTAKEKEEYGAIFIEIKNAYKTLADPPTRRQLDRDRDRDLAVQEVNGWKPKLKKAFDATDLLKKMQEESKAPGKTVEIPIAVRLEKFFWGGQKGIKRERKIKDFTEFVTEEKMYRLEVPRGAPEPLPVVFKDSGDHQEETRPDTLRFVMTAKPHATTERRGDDLFVKQAVAMRADAHMQPYLSGNVEVLRGHEVVFWGRNPFFRSTGSGAGELRVKLLGQGMGAEGSLNLTVKLGAGASGEDKIVVRIKQINTNAEMSLRLPKDATMGDAMAKAGEILDFVGAQKVQIMKAAAGGHVPYEDSQPIGSLRTLECGGTQWSEVPLSTENAAELLHSLIGITETEMFQSGLAEAYRLLDSSLSEARTKVNELWQQVADVLPDFGFQATVGSLEKAVEKALAELEGEEDMAFLVKRCKGIAIGFDPDAYEQQGSPVRKPVGLAGHPFMADRRKARMAAEPVCEMELSPALAEPVLMSTKPACSIMLFSNAQQVANPPLGQVQPRLFFAASIASLPGSKKGQREEWTELRENLGPLLRDSLFCVMRAARGILPRPLAASAAFADGDYTLDEDAVVTEAGAKTPWEEVDGEEEEDDDDEGGGGGGGMFDFDDDDDEDGDKDDDDDDDDGGGGGMFDFDDMDNAAEKKAAKAKKAEEKKRQKDAKRARSVVLKREAAAEARRKAAAEKLEAKAGGSQAVPWKELGNRALRMGDHFLAASYYSRYLEAQPEGDAEAAAAVLSSRSVCLARVGLIESAYDDAKAAVERRGQWGKAWAALAAAAAQRGPEFADEARGAFFKAVQFEPTGSNTGALLEAVKAAAEKSEEKAREEKDKGNAAAEAGDLDLAIAHYTTGVGLTPDEGESGAVLRAALLSNRCLAFMKKRQWDLAISDGRQAVAASSTHANARLRLGTALLGVGKSEEAYAEFAHGLKAEPENEQLKKARSACLSLMPLWRSCSAMARIRTRFSIDANRPKGTSKVFAMSDLHFDHKRNDEWVHNIDEFQFQEDILIVAGNVADTFVSLVRCLKALKSKFRRVFFTPGNHEFWIHPSESERFPDSIAKFNAILDACDQLEVDVFPAAICEDCYIVPLFSWYSAQYDEKDPFVDPNLKFDTHCVWPVEKTGDELWKFFLELNKALIDLPFGETVITVSHFLPRQGLPFDTNVPKVAKAMGCEELDEQIRDQYVQSKLHIYGHSRRKSAKLDAGVNYIQHSLGYENEHGDTEAFMCVYNGQSICSRTVPICSS